MNPNIKRGDIVICVDDDSGTSRHVKMNEVYPVNNTLQRGHLIELENVSIPMATDRFVKVGNNEKD